MSGAFSPGGEWVVDELKVSVVVLRGQVALGQPLHEVHLPLMLPGLRPFPGSSFAGEAHEPAFVLGVLQCRVVILQDNLGENAILALPTSLSDQLSSLVHANVKPRLSTFDADSASERVRLYDQFSVLVAVLRLGVDPLAQHLDVFAASAAVELVNTD